MSGILSKSSSTFSLKIVESSLYSNLNEGEPVEPTNIDVVEESGGNNAFINKDQENKVVANSCSEFLKTFYNTYAYCLLSSGYMDTDRSNSDGETYIYRKGSSIFQVLVVLVRILSMISRSLSEFFLGDNSVWNSEGSSKFIVIFHIFLFVIWFLTVLNFYNVLRKQGQGFADILNKVQGLCQYLECIRLNESEGSKSRVMKTKTWFKILSIVPMISILLWACWTQYLTMSGKNAKSFEEFLTESLCGFPMNPCYTYFNSTIGEEIQYLGHLSIPRTVGYTFAVVILVLGGFIAQVTAHSWETLPLIHAIIFYVILLDFTKFLKEGNKNGQGETTVTGNSSSSHFFRRRHMALKVLEEICSLSNLMDEVTGSIVAFTCLGIITYYANLINEVYSFKCILLIQVGIYAIVEGSFLFIAAEANSKLNYVVFWLQSKGERRICGLHPIGVDLQTDSSQEVESDENVNNLRTDESGMFLILSQLEKNQIGIRGRAFTITYGFVGNMLSLLLTYTILISQQTKDPGQ